MRRLDRRGALKLLGGLALAPLCACGGRRAVLAEPADPRPDRRSGRRHAGRADARDRRGGEDAPRHADPRQPLAARPAAIAVDVVKIAPPDGHTLLLGTAGMMTMFPNAYAKLGYDPVKDFVPIVNAASFELAMTIASVVPATTLAQFVAWARTQGPDGANVSFALLRRRHAVALPRRDAQSRRRPEDGPRAVPRLDAGAPGRDGRQHPGLLRHRRRRADDAAERPHQGARDQRREALAADAVGADLRRARLQDVIASAWFAYYAPAQDAAADRRHAAQRVHRRRSTRARCASSCSSTACIRSATGPSALLKTMRDDTERWGRDHARRQLQRPPTEA